MALSNPYLRFLAVFTGLYILLLMPVWLGMAGGYSSFFRGMGSIFYTNNDTRELIFMPLDDKQHPYYTRVEIANRSMMNADDSGPVRHLDFDTLGLGWRPTALLVALIVATPISWARRRWALFWGLIWQNAFLLTFLGFLIWNESSEISLVNLTPFWKHVASNLKDALVGQAGLAIPVAIWVLVTFRRLDKGGNGASMSNLRTTARA